MKSMKVPYRHINATVRAIPDFAEKLTAYAVLRYFPAKALRGKGAKKNNY
jgi:hypothetical protein